MKTDVLLSVGDFSTTHSNFDKIISITVQTKAPGPSNTGIW